MKGRDSEQAWWEGLIEQARSYAGGEDQLAQAITVLARTVYGSTSKAINPANIRRWANGDRLFPLWARLSVLRYCRDNGWQPQNADEAHRCFTLWQKGHDATLAQFASDFNIDPGSEILKFT